MNNNYNKDFLDIAQKLSFTMDEVVELYSLIEDVLVSEQWKMMEGYVHHLDTRSVHSIEVCCISWRSAKKMKNCDERAVAIGALLHDFFLYDWQKDVVIYELNRRFFLPRKHGFIHPVIALENANKYFPNLIDKKTSDIIVKHMWPITLIPPMYKEAWIVCMADKKCSLKVFKSPLELPKYLGLKRGKGKSKYM